MIVPEGFDELDVGMAESLLPSEHRDHAIVTTMVVTMQWIDPDGERKWRCYGVTTDAVSTVLGLMDLAKLDIIARTDTGLPMHYEES